MRTIRFLLQKEFRQIFRDRTMLRMLIAIPIVQLLILSSAATFEVKEGRIWLVDQDHSAASRGLVSRLTGSGRFVIAGTSASTAAADDALLAGKASVILTIPSDFERDLYRESTAPVQLIFDAQDGAQSGVLRSYMTQIIARYAAELSVDIQAGPSSESARAGLPSPRIDLRTRGWYNPELRYTDYMVPGILVLLVTIIGLAISSMNIVREKEIGTLEQLNVTPVTRTQFIAGKLIPFWSIALMDLALGMVVARLVFNIPMEGSLALIFMSGGVYLLVALGLGLLISTMVDTQQQAMFVSFSFNMVFLLMSGLFTPVNSMPPWAQMVAQLSPVKHFIDIMRTVLIRGGGMEAIAQPFLILVAYGTVVLSLAVRQHRKTTG